MLDAHVRCEEMAHAAGRAVFDIQLAFSSLNAILLATRRMEDLSTVDRGDELTGQGQKVILDRIKRTLIDFIEGSLS